MTNRMTSQEGKAKPVKPQLADFSRYKVCDSYCNPHSTTDIPEGGRHRLSRRRLEELDACLGEKDKDALLTIQQHRYLMTGQVQRLIFTDAVTATAALRATSRCLKKLRELGLVDTLSRRIGGVRAGSSSLVWYLSHAGERLLRLHEKKAAVNRRFFEPSPYFLAHTLAVAEISIQLMELCHKHEMELISLQSEPECWRSYSERGICLSLKPDLYAATISGEYEDRWFLEIDLDTESPAKVIEKCRRYHQYYRSGLEQKESGVFPLTVWIVPDIVRKQHLLEHIRPAFDKQPRLFVVIAADELEELILHGGEGDMLC
ncbi:MAG: replication-relaxation family protein [Lachnospiraceae bacterium]|nr:replication-relaxation family protein [Lachnospiraceae bacterium]